MFTPERLVGSEHFKRIFVPFGAQEIWPIKDDFAALVALGLSQLGIKRDLLGISVDEVTHEYTKGGAQFPDPYAVRLSWPGYALKSIEVFSADHTNPNSGYRLSQKGETYSLVVQTVKQGTWGMEIQKDENPVYKRAAVLYSNHQVSKVVFEQGVVENDATIKNMVFFCQAVSDFYHNSHLQSEPIDPEIERIMLEKVRRHLDILIEKNKPKQQIAARSGVHNRIVKGEPLPNILEFLSKNFGLIPISKSDVLQFLNKDFDSKSRSWVLRAHFPFGISDPNLRIEASHQFQDYTGIYEKALIKHLLAEKDQYAIVFYTIDELIRIHSENIFSLLQRGDPY